ncbi:uncharacterized protein LOC112177335 [Rosa chinensis]|uniref:uncharacterized protein LOC112177335 n=1 Tax=Rosa chinensis TaxID=74649 RepID=UPI000D0942D5|nr:uncharacterized protein LOC112177335 [Rosa chinensis]
MEIASGVGTPLQLDAATKEQRFGYYARVLVDVNLLGTLPTSIMVERENLCFPVGIEYENLPPLCTHYGLIGHEMKNCRQLKSKEVRAKQTKFHQEYRVKNKLHVDNDGVAANKDQTINDVVREGVNRVEEPPIVSRV